MDGMTDALITNLTKLGSVRVISRTSAMHYKGTHKALPEIARELNVDAVVEGSVVRGGSRVRISAQLVDASSDQNLWAHDFSTAACKMFCSYKTSWRLQSRKRLPAS